MKREKVFYLDCCQRFLFSDFGYCWRLLFLSRSIHDTIKSSKYFDKVEKIWLPHNSNSERRKRKRNEHEYVTKNEQPSQTEGKGELPKLQAQSNCSLTKVKADHAKCMCTTFILCVLWCRRRRRRKKWTNCMFWSVCVCTTARNRCHWEYAQCIKCMAFGHAKSVS